MIKECLVSYPHCPFSIVAEPIGGGVVVTGDYLDVMGLRNNADLLGTVTAIYDIGCFFGKLFHCVYNLRH
jgi:hypothetical protein